MFNTSLRRVARSSHTAQIPTRPTTPTPSIAPFTRGHSRRQSSSKPPVPPNNGLPAVPAASVKQVSSSRSESKKPAADSRLAKRKTVKAETEVVDNWAATLPSVPSLQHLSQKDVNIAAFYATYRPISITGPGPKESQLDDIEKIFAPKPRSKFKSAHSEVIYTLSSALEGLNEAIAENKNGQQDSSVAQKADIIKQLVQNNEGKTQHLDGQQTLNVRIPSGTVKLVLQEIQNRFRPFNVPPPPAAVGQQELDAIDAENAAAEAGEEILSQRLESEVEEQEVDSIRAQARKDRRSIEAEIREQEQADNTEVAEVVLNIRNKNADMQQGRFFTPRIVIDDAAKVQNISDPASRTITVGRRKRGVFIPLRRKSDMKLISVRRQRKLKMKKHKYKKLMRRTRNLRKRLDKI